MKGTSQLPAKIMRAPSAVQKQRESGPIIVANQCESTKEERVSVLSR